MNKAFSYGLLFAFCAVSLMNVSAGDFGSSASNASCRIDLGSCGNVSYNFPNGSSGAKEYAPGCICITFFYSPTCEHCHQVDSMLVGLAARFPQVTLTRYNAVESSNAELKEAFDILYKVPSEKRAYVPAVYIGDYYFIGEEEASGGLENAVKKISGNRFSMRLRQSLWCGGAVQELDN